MSARFVAAFCVMCCCIIVLVGFYLLAELEVNSSPCLGSTCSQLDVISLDQNHAVEHSFKRNKSFIFHAGFDSPGGTISNLSFMNTVEELEKVCLSNIRCVGFNSDGVMKDRLLPFERWTPLHTKQKGLHVTDMNYCSSHEGECLLNSTCFSMTGGRYSCNRREEVLQNSDESKIHIVIAVEGLILPAVLPFLVSLKLHNKKDLIIHVVISDEDKRELQKMISCGFAIPGNIQIDVVRLDLPETIKQLIAIEMHSTQYLSSPGNFVRFCFDQLFPSLDYILYLDVDTIVQNDLSGLWKEVISTKKLLVVVPRAQGKIGSDLRSNVTKLYHKRYGEEINMSSIPFNAGVLGFNLDKWRRRNLTREVIYWMSENKKNPLWELGTQPILYVVAYGDWEFVDRRWNVDSLGRRANIPAERVSEAYILHWNGLGKPWLRPKYGSKYVARYKYRWEKYDEGLCSRRGKCLQTENRTACKCNHGFQGDFCGKTT